MIRDKPKFRDDLKTIRKMRHGNEEYVVKDPFNMEYFRFSKFEYDILLLMDGVREIADIVREVNRGIKDKESRYNKDDISEFVDSIDKINLLEKTQAEKNAMIIARVRADRKNMLQSKKGSLTYKRIPIIDPEHYFNWLEPKIRFFWTKGFVLVSLTMMALAGMIIIANWDEVSRGILAIFTFQQDNAWGYVSLYAIVFIIIALHEHAHGLTCKHFGGEVHELGFLFLFFQPCMYANVSDAWTFADRGKRLWVTAAGGYFEFWLGSIFTFIWWGSAPGTFINSISYQAMTVCGFSSVLFNFNPLIKLDGYYMLCDLLETHNLKNNSLAYVKAHFKQLIFGVPMEDMPYTKQERRAYLIYGVCSTMYIIGLLTGIFFMIGGMLIEALYGIGVVISAFIGWKLFGRYFRNTYRFTRDLLAKARPMLKKPIGKLAMAGVIAAIVLFFVMPVVHRIEGKTTLTPIGDEMIRARSGGTLVEVRKNHGDKVEAGEVIAVLENESLRLQLQSNLLKLQQLNIKERKLEFGSQQTQIERVRNQIESLERQIKQEQILVAALTIRAPISGIVVSQQDLTSRLQSSIGQGAPFCRVINPSVLRAEIEIDERYISEVQVDHPVLLDMVADNERDYVSRVTRVISPDTLDPAAAEADGGVPEKFRVIVDFKNSGEEGESFLRPGMTGVAKIDVGRRMMISHLLDALRKNMKADLLF